jgi:transaldolase
VKHERFDDTRYVVELVAPDTVNTMPEVTLRAVADHVSLHETSAGRPSGELS